MNLQTLLPIASQMVGRDLSGELQLFLSTREAVGTAAGEQGRKFLLGHYKQLPEFLASEEGKKATVAFLNAWAVKSYPQLAPEPAPKIELPPMPESVPEPPTALFG